MNKQVEEAAEQQARRHCKIAIYQTDCMYKYGFTCLDSY